MSLIIPSLLIFLLSLVTIFPTFHLGLFGDDWLAFFRHAQHLGPKSSGEWNYLTYYLTPYGPQDILMGLLQKFYDFQSGYYYITSFVLRLIAAFSFYPLVFCLTKNKLASFFAVLLFSITVTGFDTTNWVFNMPSYITIAFFNLCLYFSLKHREEGKLVLLVLSALLYYLSYITTPIRMHGSLLFIFLLEVFWVIQEWNYKTLKRALIRFVIFLAVFFIVRFTGHSQGPPEETVERFSIGIKTMLELFRSGRFDFIFNPVTMFGSMIIPDFIIPSFRIISKSRLLFLIILPSLLGFSAIAALLLKDMSLTKLKFFKKITIAVFCWILIVVLTFQFNLITFNDSRLVLLTLIGGFSIIFIFLLLLEFYRQKNIATALFLGLSWSILSFFFAWWWTPTSIFPTTYRYLIVSAAGISILFGTIISLGKEKRQLSLFVYLCLFLIIHIIAARIYLSALLDSHSQEISNKIWSSIPHVDEIGKSKEPIIFFFEGDNTNAGILHDVVTFGFPPHMALLYNLMEGDGLPVPMSEFKDVVSAVRDGKPMPAYGYPVKPVPINRIYAFHLEGKDNLINITNLVREKLTRIKF